MKMIDWISASAALFLGLASLYAQNSAAVATSPAGGSAQNKGKVKGKQVPQGPTPHFADGGVDLSGVWNGGGPIGDLGQGNPDVKIPLNAKGIDVDAIAPGQVHQRLCARGEACRLLCFNLLHNGNR